MTMVVMLREMVSVTTAVTTSLVFIPDLHVAGSVTVQGRSCHRVKSVPFLPFGPFTLTMKM